MVHTQYDLPVEPKNEVGTEFQNMKFELNDLKNFAFNYCQSCVTLELEGEEAGSKRPQI